MLNKIKQLARRWRGPLIVVPCTAIFIIGLRSLAWLQPLELPALDTYFQLRPPEPTDNRFVIVSIEESDIQKLKEYPVSDKILANVLTKIKAQKPRVIGLDIYRDVPKPPGTKELTAVFKSTPNLIGIQKVIGDPYSPKIAPPPVLKRLDRVAAADMIVDGDGVIRRGILFPGTNNGENLLSLGLAIAVEYLKAQGISPTADKNGWLKLSQTSLVPFEKNDGGYVGADAGGYQILLNYRGSALSFVKVSLSDVLEDRVAPNLMRDRIVLIGAASPSLNDTFLTPFSRGSGTTPISTPGVEIQANIASSIINAAISGRPLIKVWSEPLENIWITCWIVSISIIAWHWAVNQSFHSTPFIFKLICASALASGTLISISYALFLWGWWIPVVPPLIGIVVSAIVISEYVYIRRIEDYSQNLELKVNQRTQELYRALDKLEVAQQQIINKEKLAALGTLAIGVAHEFRNPLHSILIYNGITAETAQKIKNILIGKVVPLATDPTTKIYQLLDEIVDNCQEIEKQVDRADKVVQELLAYSRGTKPSNIELTNINQLLESIIKLLKFSLNESARAIKFEVSYDDAVSAIAVYPQELSRAMINIVKNACDAVLEAQTKVKDTISEFIPTITITTKNLEKVVQVIVQDNGGGISSENINRVFDPFFTTKPPGKGTGLGLAIAQEIIVGKHQGEIDVKTHKELTKFIIKIPKGEQK